MTIGYIRTSTEGQDGQGQELEIRREADRRGMKIDRIESETISSRKKDRKIYQVIESLNPGDILIISELSRLGRSSLAEIGRTLGEIERKGSGVIIVKDGLEIVPGAEMDMKTQAVLMALSLAARIERDMISERTKSALKAKKEAGVKLGRPTGSKLEARADEIEKYQALGLNKTAISKLLGVSRSTLDHYLETRVINQP